MSEAPTLHNLYYLITPQTISMPGLVVFYLSHLLLLLWLLRVSSRDRQQRQYCYNKLIFVWQTRKWRVRLPHGSCDAAMRVFLIQFPPTQTAEHTLSWRKRLWGSITIPDTLSRTTYTASTCRNIRATHNQWSKCWGKWSSSCCWSWMGSAARRSTS